MTGAVPSLPTLASNFDESVPPSQCNRTICIESQSFAFSLDTAGDLLSPVRWDRGVPVYGTLLLCMNSSIVVPYLVGIVSRAEQRFNRSRSAPLESSCTSERARIDKSSENSSQTHARTVILHSVIASMSESVRIQYSMGTVFVWYYW